MATPIQRTTINAETLVDPVSRYKSQPVIYYGDNKLVAYETYIRKPYSRKGNERIMMINKGVEFRPDLVSYDVYGFPESWWRIMEANGMKDIMEFKAGVTIFLPDEVF